MPKQMFAKNLNHLLQSRRLSQAQFAEKLGFSHSAAVPWLKGSAFPKLKTLIDISDLFNIPVEKLVRHDLTKTS